jgi:chemotaxis signal transduction protein
LSPSDALARFDPPEEQWSRNNASEAPVRYGFHVGGMGLLIRRDTVAELNVQATVFPIPNAPRWLRGLINLRGNLIPIYDLSELLEVSDEDEQSDQKLLILDSRNEMIGVLIDGLPQAVQNLGKPTRIPPLPSVLKKHVTEAYAGDTTIWLEFDHRGFFLSLTGGGPKADNSSSEQ